MKKILIIDDEITFSALVKINLELNSDYKVFVAGSGPEGLRLAKSKKPDIILLDIIMPNMDGFEVMKRLKEDENTVPIPIIMVTALADEGSKEKAWELYDEAYITKPIEIAALKAKIEEVLSKFKKDPH
jgi:DNA-binding response OmpR family regulator